MSNPLQTLIEQANEYAYKATMLGSLTTDQGIRNALLKFGACLKQCAKALAVPPVVDLSESEKEVDTRMDTLGDSPDSRTAPTVTGDTSDGYHTFNELYAYRKAYNALLFNEWAAHGLYDVHKAQRHSDGEPCFGGGWFIVVAETPAGQISNHYKDADWEMFHLPERQRSNVYDGHTPQMALDRLLALSAGERSSARPRDEMSAQKNEGEVTRVDAMGVSTDSRTAAGNKPPELMAGWSVEARLSRYEQRTAGAPCEREYHASHYWGGMDEAEASARYAAADAALSTVSPAAREAQGTDRTPTHADGEIQIDPNLADEGRKEQP